MIEVRQAVTSDVVELLPLVSEYWTFEYIPAFEPERVAAQLSRLLSDKRLGTGWIALDRADAVGYLLAVYVFSLENSGLTAEIDELFVLPQRRGDGIGRSLLRAAESAWIDAGCTRVGLRLSRDNDSARAFYRRNGYSERTGCELLEKALHAD